MFKRRIGPDPHRLGRMTGGAVGCPDIWELQNGDFAIIGKKQTKELVSSLPTSASCGFDEEIVVIPRELLINAKNDIPTQ